MANNGPFYEQGVYCGEITDQALGKSQSKGTPQFAIKFKVLHKIANDGSEEQVPAQYERTAYLYFTEATSERTITALKHLGYTRDSFKFLDPAHPQAHSFVRRQAEFVCNHEEYEGKWREKWNVRTPYESSPLEMKKLESKELRDLDALFGKTLKGNGTVQPKPPAQRQPQATAVASADDLADDDIPF